MDTDCDTFKFCPRCGDTGFEVLETHSHCVQCLYSPVLDEEDPKDPLNLEWAKRQLGIMAQVSKPANTETDVDAMHLSIEDEGVA